MLKLAMGKSFMLISLFVTVRRYLFHPGSVYGKVQFAC